MSALCRPHACDYAALAPPLAHPRPRRRVILHGRPVLAPAAPPPVVRACACIRMRGRRCSRAAHQLMECHTPVSSDDGLAMQACRICGLDVPTRNIWCVSKSHTRVARATATARRPRGCPTLLAAAVRWQAPPARMHGEADSCDAGSGEPAGHEEERGDPYEEKSFEEEEEGARGSASPPTHDNWCHSTRHG